MALGAVILLPISILGSSVQATTVQPSVNWNPSAAPEQLTDFAATINKSMVTVYCGNSLGSGWTSTVTINQDAIAAGYKTYIITNHHVIEECTYSTSSRYIEVRQGGVRYPAYVWSWDRENDLAGLHTTADLPKLQWNRVPRPLPGQWVAAFGSPFGLSGSITTGIVSFVGDNQLTSTAPINPGNSGGPLVDNKGRVVGTNTATIVGSNGFGIVVGTPALCDKIVRCSDPDGVWTDGEMKSAILLQKRDGPVIRLMLTGLEISGETVTLFVKRLGETTYSEYSTKQVVSDSGEAEFSLYEPGRIYVYAEVAGITTNRVIVTEARPAPKVRGMRARAKGQGRVVVSWKVPDWATPENSAWYRYQVGSDEWKVTRRNRLNLSGLEPGKKVRIKVQSSYGDPDVYAPGRVSRVVVRVK